MPSYLRKAASTRIFPWFRFQTVAALVLMLVTHLPGEEPKTTFWIADPFAEDQRAWEIDFLDGDVPFYEKSEGEPGVVLALGVFVYLFEKEVLKKKLHIHPSMEGYDSEWDYETEELRSVTMTDEMKGKLMKYLHQAKMGDRSLRSREVPREIVE